LELSSIIDEEGCLLHNVMQYAFEDESPAKASVLTFFVPQFSLLNAQKDFQKVGPLNLWGS